jgi:hypothetical protein
MTAVSIANDIGSDVQTIFLADLAALQYNPATYYGPIRPWLIQTANGLAHRMMINIEIQIIKADGTAVTGWFRERAMITPPVVGMQYRLSGRAMRDHLYFATAPGNAMLYVKKNGIITQLPIV